MLRPTRAGRLAAISAVTVLLLASCGGDDEPAADDGGNNNTADAETTESTQEPGGAPKGDGQFKVGALLPVTGDLAYLGPPEFAGVKVAVDEINEAGGVLGKPVTQHNADSGDGTPKLGVQGANKLLSQNVDVVVGAASSSVSLEFIDTLIKAKTVQFSPANTSPEFDTYNDQNFYFRTAPSDVLQGAVLGNLVATDGAKNVAILARQDSYGENLAINAEKKLKEAGVTIATKKLYSPDAQTFTAEVNAVASANPDAVIVIGFSETTKIIPRLIAAGVGPQDVQTYFVDGNISNYGTGKDGFPAGTLEGTKATLPGADPGDFQKRLLEADPKLEEFSYGPESYDAVVMSALAAEAAGSDSGEAVSSELVNISKDGTECEGFTECVELVKSGEDIDYQGVSGPCDLSDVGSPITANIGIYEFNEDNNYENIDYVAGTTQ